MQLNALVIQKLLGIVVEILDRLDATLENSIIYVALNFHQIVMALCWLLASFFFCDFDDKMQVGNARLKMDQT